MTVPKPAANLDAGPLSISVANHNLTLLPARAYKARFTAPENSVGFAFDAQSGNHAIGTDRFESFFRIPNSLATTPKGCDVRSVSERGGEYLLVSGPSIRVTAGRYETNVQSSIAVGAAGLLRRWMLGNRMPDEMTVESQVSQLGTAANCPLRPVKAARWMTKRRFRQISDAIEDNLGMNLTVAKLAKEIGVSASFLNRAFSAYCGQTPYDYVLSRRLQRARQLIATTNEPLSEIAYCAGFSSQSHMTAIMKARLGLTSSMINRPQIS